MPLWGGCSISPKILGGEKGEERAGERFVTPLSPYKPLINEGLNAVWGGVGGFGLLSQSDLNEFIEVRWLNMTLERFFRRERSSRVTGVLSYFFAFYFTFKLFLVCKLCNIFHMKFFLVRHLFADCLSLIAPVTKS